MVIVHRLGLVTTGAGSVADHITSTAWEARTPVAVNPFTSSVAQSTSGVGPVIRVGAGAGL